MSEPTSEPVKRPRKTPAKTTTGRTAGQPTTRHANPPRPAPAPAPDALTWRDTPGYDAVVADHGDPTTPDPQDEDAGNKLRQQIAEAAASVQPDEDTS